MTLDKGFEVIAEPALGTEQVVHMVKETVDCIARSVVYAGVDMR